MSAKQDDQNQTRTSLVRRLKAKDEDGWREFYEQHRQMIFARAISRGLSLAEADEVVQETFLTLFKNIDGFIYDPSRGRLRGYVSRTANWRIEDSRDKRLPEPATDFQQYLDPDGTALIHRVPDNGPGASVALEEKERGELAKALHDAILRRIQERTSPKQYQLYELHKVQGLPVDEVCRLLDAKPKDVYNATTRIYQRIQEEVELLRQHAAAKKPHGHTTALFRDLEQDLSLRKRTPR